MWIVSYRDYPAVLTVKVANSRSLMIKAHFFFTFSAFAVRIPVGIWAVSENLVSRKTNIVQGLKPKSIVSHRSWLVENFELEKANLSKETFKNAKMFLL